jgi:hypothetical protein
MSPASGASDVIVVEILIVGPSLFGAASLEAWMFQAAVGPASANLTPGPSTSGAVVFPDGRRAVGLTRDRLQPLIDQSIAPAASRPTVNGQVLTNGIVRYLAQDVSLAIDRLSALD